MTAPTATDSVTLRVVIADDEPLARTALERALQSIPHVRLVGIASHGTEAVDIVRRERPDLLLLDVQMPGLDGFSVLEHLGQALPPAVVFVTAYDAHAVRAFQAYAVDFLLKPFDEGRLQTAIERARVRVRAATVLQHEEGAGASAADNESGATRTSGVTPVDETTTERLERLLTSLLPTPPTVERFVVRVGTRSVVVAVADVDWIEAADNYACLHVGAAKHFIRETMRSVDRRLDPRQFARIHRSAIVNLSRVKELKALPSGDHEVLLHSGEKLQLSRSWRESFEQRLGTAL